MNILSIYHDFFNNRFNKKIILLISDSLLIGIAFILAYILRYYAVEESFFDISLITNQSLFIGGICAFNIIIMQIIFKQYQSIWTIAGFSEFLMGITSIVFATIINLIMCFIIFEFVDFMIIVLVGIISLILLNGIRIAWRLTRRVYNRKIYSLSDVKRVLIIGAGSAGVLVLNEYKNNPKFNKKVVAFVDDDINKLGTRIGNVPVKGNRNDILRLIDKYDVNEVIIAIASMSQTNLGELLNILKSTSIKVRIMPGLNEILDGKLNIHKIREVEIEDLLARDPINLNHDGIKEYIENQVVMVTGGGGSIGSELCRQVIRFKPKEIIIVDIYENNAYDLQNELLSENENINLKVLIASVRDKERLDYIFDKYRPNIVFHAAAHKHVPLMEDSPSEAIKNNVLGTLNCAELADTYNVKKFVLISTDKAVNPTNVMGATKRLCEMILQAIDKTSSTEFVAVRFGNVLGSNGSVVPLFKKQISKGGPVTLTHKDITRYFMTIPEAAQLVLQAGGFAKGGEIFVLDMGKPVRIYDLAKNLISLSGFEPDKDIEIQITGLRPGEKLYEELLMQEEGLKNTSHSKIFIARPGVYNFYNLKLEIEELLTVASQKDHKLLKEKLREIVPTYNEPTYDQELNEKLI